MPLAIDVQCLEKKYGTKKALVDVSLSVESGMILGLLGPNGAGKTTTLRILAGLVRSSSGTVRVLGADPWRERSRLAGKVGVLLDAAFHTYLTAENNLRLLGQLQGSNPTEQRGLLEQVGLSKAARSRVSSFSFGMTQRLGLAQALLGNPKVLILDEPMVGLDPVGIADLKEQIRRLAKMLGAAVVLSSHQLSDIEDICDDVTVIHHGRSVLRGTVKELTQQKGYIIDVESPVTAMATLESLGIEASMRDSLVFVHTDRGDCLAAALKGLLEVGLGIWHVEPVRNTLYDVFNEQVGDTTNG